MTTQRRTQRLLENREQTILWADHSPLTMVVNTNAGEIRTRYGRFVGGASDGVELVEIDTGAVRVMVLPSRGMAVWMLESDGVRFGWDSPVKGPVHPSRVASLDPSGLGWLEGFDELLVRCGLESNGAPEFDEQGTLRYPLHGRIGNLAADSLSIEYDESSGSLELIGEVCEAKMFVKRLRLRSRLRVRAGSRDIEILDDVTNELSSPSSIQLLYHINLGPPLLGSGARLHAPVRELAPKDELSAGEVDRWNEFAAPEPGYRERVYLTQLHADDTDQTAVMLKSADSTRGFGVRFNITGLPNFVLWKNTAAESDGYVVGMEPATNFPNRHSFEQQHGRVVELTSGGTASFRLSLHPLTSTSEVERMAEEIDRLAGNQQPAAIQTQPNATWSE